MTLQSRHTKKKSNKTFLILNLHVQNLAAFHQKQINSNLKIQIIHLLPPQDQKKPAPSSSLIFLAYADVFKPKSLITFIA